MSTLKVDTILKRSGTGTITLGQSGDTLTIPTGASLSLPGGSNGQALITDGSGTLSFSTVGGVMTPAFEAYKASSSNVSDNTAEKIAYDTEVFDVGGCYDHSSNYRFTPTTAGKYYVFTHMVFYSSVNENINGVGVQIYKNGTRYINSDATHHTHQPTRYQSFSAGIIDFNGSSDYVEAYAYVDVTSSATIYVQGNSTQPITYFGAYKLI